MAESRKRVIQKVILVGDDSPGTTHLLGKLTNPNYRETDTYPRTIGFDFANYESEALLEDGLVDAPEITVQMWDASSNERYAVIANGQLKGKNVIGFCVDCTIPLSEQKSKLARLYSRYEKYAGEPKPPYVVILTKSDKTKKHNHKGLTDADVPAIREIFHLPKTQPEAEDQLIWVSTHEGHDQNIPKLKQLFHRLLVKRLLNESKQEQEAKLESKERRTIARRPSVIPTPSVINKHVVFLGQQRGGKSSVFDVMSGRQFKGDYITSDAPRRVTYVENVSDVFQSEFGSNQKIQLSLWDTPGNERFEAKAGVLPYQNVDILVFVVDGQDTLENQKDRLNQLYDQAMAGGYAGPQPILVLNKFEDKSEPKITKADEAELQQILGGVPDDHVIKVSAKTGNNIGELNNLIIKKLCQYHRKSLLTDAINLFKAAEEKLLADAEKYWEAYPKGRIKIGHANLHLSPLGLRAEAYGVTIESRAAFSDLLRKTEEVLASDCAAGHIKPKDAQAAAKAVKNLAPKVGDCSLTITDLKQFAKAIQPVLSTHTKSARHMGRLFGVAMTALAAGLVLGLLTGPLAPVVLGVTIAGIVGAAVLLGYGGGKLFEGIKMYRNPHILLSLKKSAKTVQEQKDHNPHLRANPSLKNLDKHMFGEFKPLEVKRPPSKSR